MFSWGQVWLSRQASKELRWPVYAKLLKGTNPIYIQSATAIPRPEVEKKLSEYLAPESVKNNFTRFSVVVGPYGCGKTYTLRKFCNDYPSGVIYYEIDDASSFKLGLSKEVGMKSQPHTILNLVLRYISEKYTHYHVLPDDPQVALTKVLKVLQTKSLRYQKEEKKIPVLVIHSIDLIAKDKPDLCCRLITTAKVMTNDNRIKMALVSSCS